MLRKLSIVCVATAFGAGTVNQLFAISMLVFFWVALQVSRKQTQALSIKLNCASSSMFN